MQLPLLLEIKPGEDYQHWNVRCCECRAEWIETTHELYNVVALSCPFCAVMQSIPRPDIHSDTPVDDNEEGLEE